MSKEKQEKKKKRLQNQESNKSLKVPPIAIIDNIVLSRGEAWAYYILSEKPYDFLSNSAKVSLARSTMSALSSLCQSQNKKVDCHLLITNQAFDPSEWFSQMHKIHDELINTESKAFDDFVIEQAMFLYESDYKKRVTYLGVKLYGRGTLDINAINPLEFGFKEMISAFKKSIDSVFQFTATEINQEEEARARTAEAEIFRTLSNSTLVSRRPTCEEILLTIKRRFYPAMPAPYLETDHEHRIGLSDIVIESGGTVDVRPRWLKMTQFINNEILEGYRATLSFSKFPNEMYMPGPLLPFLYRPAIMPFTVSSRFSLMPVEHMRKELGKKKKETDDEIDNLAESGQRVNVGVKNTLQDISTLESDLENVKQPWISGTYKVTVEATNEESLKNIISALKQEYAKSGYVLSWTTGDQLNLFREEFLGGKLEKKDFTHTTNLAMLGISGINYGNSVGDPVRQIHKFTNKDNML